MWVWRPQKGLRGSWLRVCGFWNDLRCFLAAEREKTFACLLAKNSQYRPEPAQEAAMAKKERNQTNKNAWLANINSMLRGKQFWVFQLEPVPLLSPYSLQGGFALQSSSSISDHEEAANRGHFISCHTVRPSWWSLSGFLSLGQCKISVFGKGRFQPAPQGN